jgi:hypothetical protein
MKKLIAYCLGLTAATLILFASFGQHRAVHAQSSPLVQVGGGAISCVNYLEPSGSCYTTVYWPQAFSGTGYSEACTVLSPSFVPSVAVIGKSEYAIAVSVTQVYYPGVTKNTTNSGIQCIGVQ